MKITVKHYDEEYAVQTPDGAALPRIMLAFCNMLMLAGWSQENIIELFNDEDTRKAGTPRNNPFEWEVH